MLDPPSQVPRPTCQSGNLTITYPTAFYEVKVTKLELGQSLDAILCKVNLSLLLCTARAAVQSKTGVLCKSKSWSPETS